jgi:sigma-E factor negative regulatory protein RseA
MECDMSAARGDGSDRAERLSALVDGELAAGDTAAACDAWKGDAEMRRTWHAYHLIGDVLRSDDLASQADHDRCFLLALQARLATEPVVLAPSPLESPSRAPRPRWMLPSAMAAGFVLVAGTFVVLGGPGAVGSRPVAVAVDRQVPADDSALRRVSVTDLAEMQLPVAVDGRMIRDARLDRYLAAHKQFAGTSALGVPSAFLRSATVDVEPR